MLYTPSLQTVVLLLVSPLALLVALWGMSDVQELEHMNTSVNVPVSSLRGRCVCEARPLALRCLRSR